MEDNINKKVRREAKFWSRILLGVSLGIIFFSWKSPNSGIITLYSLICILICSIHTWRCYKLNIKMEKLIYMIGLMVIIIFALTSLAQMK